MTNKVKPFYIKITDDMTPQMVQDAFDKCVDAGADAEECIADTSKKHKYQDAYHENFNYFGVSDYNETYLTDVCCNYGDDAQEITLGQLDEWLGLEVEEEWKNGDECIYQGKTWHFVSILSDEFHGTAVIFERVSEKLKQVDLSKLEKPETPEQKAERERDENGKAMWQGLGYLNPKTPTWESLKPEYAECWRNFAEKTGYRKQ